MHEQNPRSSDPAGHGAVDAAEQEIALHLVDLRCDGCARRAEVVLRAAPGVRAARVRWRDASADVRFDRRHTSERALLATLGRAGYGAEPAERVGGPRGATVAVAAIAIAGIVLVEVAAPGARLGGLVQLALAAIALAVAASTLGRRVLALLRRGVVDADALALTGAAAMLALGARDLAAGAPHPGALPAALGLTLGARAAPAGALAAAAAACFGALAVRFAEAAARRRRGRALAGAVSPFDVEVRAILARLAVTEHTPVEGSWEDAAARGVVTAALGCASFALVTHGCLGEGPLADAAVSAAAAVLLVASPRALLTAAPAARAAAVIRARSAGVLVRDPAALAGLGAELDAGEIAVAGDRRGPRAPIVLLTARIDRLPWLFAHGRALRGVLHRAFALGAFHNLALIPLAALGYVPPLAAAGLALAEALAGLAGARKLS